MTKNVFQSFTLCNRNGIKKKTEPRSNTQEYTALVHQWGCLCSYIYLWNERKRKKRLIWRLEKKSKDADITIRPVTMTTLSSHILYTLQLLCLNIKNSKFTALWKGVPSISYMNVFISSIALNGNNNICCNQFFWVNLPTNRGRLNTHQSIMSMTLANVHLKTS